MRRSDWGSWTSPRRVVGLGSALAAMLLALPSLAAEDGGTESVFAQGAGNRALALGGAFTAVADDASATVWNPAGLGTLARMEFVASQASLYDLEISEQFASIGIPNWRWGTSALSFRRLGVTGIEERDDRNVLLGSFEDTEIEIGLAYARALGDAWRVGGLAKMHRQSVAGYSDTGIGLDLGVHVHPGLALGKEGAWTRRFTLGLAMRNLIQPTIRLDEVDVPDPVSTRLGAAYRTPFLGDGEILVAVDLEKGRDAAADLHAGLEVTPHPLLSLRAGWNGDDMTAGAGIRWRLYRFDYLYEDNAIDPLHRFGVSFGFGSTVEEKRFAALAAEDEAFRARLEETFDRRRRERVETLVEQATRALAANRLDEALDVVANIQALEPDDPRIGKIESQILERRASDTEARGEFARAAILWGQVLAVAPDHQVAQDGITRCRAESNRRAERTTLIRELFANALDAFTVGDLPAAQRHLTDILALSPDDSEAQAMLTRTKTAILARVGSLLKQGGRAIDGGRFTEAAGHLNGVRALAPKSTQLGALDARLAKAERDLQRAARQHDLARVATSLPTSAPVKAPTLSRKKRKEIENLYRRGMEAMESERPDDALRYWELVWLADADYQNVSEFLKREYLLRGLESFSTGGLDEAIRLWEKAHDVDPNDEKTLGYLSRAREQLTRTREILGE